MPAAPRRPRLACVRIPRFPLAVAWPHDSPLAPGPPPEPRQLALSLGGDRPAPPPRARPAWDAEPRALAEGDTLRVVSYAAARAGVRAGMRTAAARARCGALEIRGVDAEATAQAVTRVTAALLRAAPQVTPAAGAAGTWWVGAGGFDAIGGEAALAEALLDLVHHWHPEARVAIADSCVAARAATWSQTPASGAAGTGTPTGAATPAPAGRPLVLSQATIIPPGGDAAFLAPAPLGLVPMPADLRDGLTILGLRTLGAFAALEPADVEQRWGAAGLAAWRLARGDDPRRPGLAIADRPRSVHAELPVPARTVEPVQFLVRAALERLVDGLLQDARAAASIAITLELDVPRHVAVEARLAAESAGALDAAATETLRLDGWAPAGRTITREVRPARPLARLEPLVEQCRALLERWALPAPVTGVTVHVPATTPLTADQGDLLAPAWRDAAATVDAVVTRLRAALDPDGTHDVVVHPEAVDAHRLDRAGRWVTADAWTLAERAETTRAERTETTARTATDDATDEALDEPTHEPTRGPTRGPTPAGAASPAAVRLLDPPPAVHVTCTADGIPRTVHWDTQTLTLTRAVHERLTGDWWHGGHYAHDCWRATTEGEGELLLVHERDAWFLQGWVD